MFYKYIGQYRAKKCSSLIKIAIISFVVSTSANAASQDKELNLSQALKLAIERNPTLKIFKFKDDGLVGEYQTANLKPQYELGVEAEQFAGTGDLQGIDSLETTVSLSSVIEMGGKRESRGGVVSSKRNVLVTQQRIKAIDLLSHSKLC
jgi:outer membrane protein, heavy metal efflux system